MKRVLLFLALAGIAAAQCGPNGSLLPNPLTRSLGCTGKTGAAGYSGTFTGATGLTVTAVTHGQGLKPVGFCYDNATPHNLIAQSSGFPTVAANGDVVFAWSGSKTGYCVISALGNQTGAAGAAGSVTVGATTTGAAGSNAAVNNTGSSSAAVLEFTIPRGDTGSVGPDGQGAITESEPAGANCTYGGLKVTAASGVSYVCNGNPGNNGAGGNLTYIDCTVTSSTSLTCTHNLNTTFPMVWCKDSNGLLLGSAGSAGIVDAITYTSANVVTFAFSPALTGTCRVACPDCTSTAAIPTYDNDTATYNNDVAVTPSSSTPSVTICWTDDGSPPAASTPGTCSNGTAYDGNTIPITATATVLKSISTKSGLVNSAVKSATYTLQVANVIANPTAPYTGVSTDVTLTTATTGGDIAIHYRTDGVVASCSDTTYSGAITVSSTTTITAIGCKTNYVDSAAFSGVYTVSNTVATPTDSPGTGTYTNSQAVTLNLSTPGSTGCYTTDGSTPAASTPGTCSTGSTYASPFTVTSTTTVKALATKATMDNSGVLTSTYTIRAAQPTDSPGAGTYSTTQSVTLSTTTSGGDKAIHYTTDGSAPDCSSTTYSSAISVSATTTIKAITCKTGMSNSPVLTSVYTFQAGLTYVQSKADGNDAVSSITSAAASPSYQVGSLIYVRASFRDACSAATISLGDNKSGGSHTYTQIGSAYDNTSLTCQYDFYTVATGTFTTVTATATASVRMFNISAAEFTGRTTFDATATGFTNSGFNLTTGSLSTSSSSTLLVLATNSYNGDTGTVSITGASCTWSAKLANDPYADRGSLYWCELTATHSGAITYTGNDTIQSVRVTAFK